ncbi:MAG: pyruvate carboxylase subunit A [Chloroflexi bacterium]|nr:MAG: pyruvate carboxylase subunit A [Chloroflexota bacterium]
MFNKVLIANRGEIACRIILACRELGVASAALFSDADQDMPWVRLADESFHLPGVTAAETYLNQTAVLDIAVQCGAAAIHPGYGFLSENPEFAEACAARGITFIGPSPAAMRVLGSKVAARVLAQQAGAPVIPGVDGADKTLEELEMTANAMGYPVLIKASAGGGGKGMRVVQRAEEFADALQSARSEARSAFGNDHVLIEKFFTEIHHVEVQVLGDQYGNLVHLYERECSIQRRHQKIIEESPSPVVSRFEAQGADLRKRMTAAAVSLAKAANYVSAGTIEFVVDGNGRFYFLEMNTRLQVEHPVTEFVTGIDLASWQIRIANGEPLSFRQADIGQNGHALECRVYAEDPANHFLPSIGEISYYRRPSGPGVRVDDGIQSGTRVSPFYDPMLAKVITHGYDRDDAVRKMGRALSETAVLGVTSNLPFLRAILEEKNFQQGHTSTNYIQSHMAEWQPAVALSEVERFTIAAAEFLAGDSQRDGGKTAVHDTTFQADPWREVGSWRNVEC